MLKRSRTYYKYLLSYVALLLTAVIALVVFSQAFFVVQLRSNLMETHRSRLRQTVQKLDSDIQQIYTIDYQISSVNENFLSYYLSDQSPMRDLRIVNEFKNLLAPLSFISEMALVERDAENVYTSTAVYAKPLFFSNIFAFDEWSDPEADLAALRGRIVRPAERINATARYITFINEASVFSRLQDTVQMYFVKESYFIGQLAPEGEEGQEGAIWDASGRLIVSTLPMSSMPTGSRLRLNGTEYLVLNEPSAVMDWTYTFLLPASTCLAPIHRAQITLLVFMLVLLIMGALVIHYAMQVNYKPIKELTQALGASTQGDELSSLKDVISSLSAQNEHMRAQLMCSPDGQALRDTLLFSLLKGKFSSFEAFNQEAAPLDMVFDKQWYQVLMLRHFGEDEEVPRESLASALASVLGPDYTFHFRELFEPSMIVCLVGMPENCEDDLHQRCQRLLDVCAQEHALSFTLGMSGCYQDIRQITAACFEATQAVREYFIRGRHQLIRYSELNRTLDIHDNVLIELRDLPAKKPEQQMVLLRQFVGTLKERKVPALLAKSYCNSAVQLLLSSNADRAVNMEDLFTISYLRTADDYLAFMLHMLAPEPEPETAQAHQEPVSELLGRIYACIGENYDDCNFSIQDAADRLGLSGSYLSQYFKQQTGNTLTGYVADLRIRKACTLLENTVMPLQMISESVGYYNLNSFIRRFKQITGVTPGEYRKAHQ
ncbi:MAG: helix-turn-helix domain-containing protein [Clostridia bacterium]|nr:helix-turn-helix domain-containing protein [Clostridia bacterium]